MCIVSFIRMTSNTQTLILTKICNESINSSPSSDGVIGGILAPNK